MINWKILREEFIGILVGGMGVGIRIGISGWIRGFMIKDVSEKKSVRNEQNK